MSDEREGLLSRRSFCYGLGGAAALLGLGGVVRTLGSEPVCHPPGGQDEANFYAACLRCEKCREACPQQVLKPTKIEAGLISVRTPTMRFADNWCDFCESANNGSPRCIEACSTGALALPAGATKENTIIGKAYIRNDWCLGWLLKGCRVCYDTCPYEAIELDEFQRPHIIWDTCNGCGKCERDCISMKATSIVDGAAHRAVTIHATATVEKLLAGTTEEVWI
jgi:ferredoxin-type protein NapG